MKIGIVGTGAVGGFLGAKLSLANNDVVFLSKGKILDKVKKNGLKFESGNEIHLIKKTTFTNNAKELSNCKYIFFSVKSYDTKSAANQIKDHISDEATIITPQNGIHNDIILSQIFGKQKIIPGMVKVGVAMPKPGYVKHTRLGILTIGEYNGQVTDRVKEIQNLVKKSGMECIVSKQIQLDRWKKYIWNCTFNIIAAITELNLEQILANKYLKQLCIEVIREIVQVAKSKQIQLNELDVINGSLELSKKLGQFKPSTLEDVEKGKPIELDAFTGIVINYAKEEKVNVVRNQALYALLDGKVRSKKFTS